MSSTRNGASGSESFSVTLDLSPSVEQLQTYATKSVTQSNFVPNVSEFQFMSSSPSLDSPTGQIKPTEVVTSESIPGLRRRGPAANFLENKGFGWLLEVDDDNEQYQKPLLEELDIDLKDIFYKLRCVVLPLPQFGFNNQIVRDNPDFWGPLFVVLLYSLVSLYGQFRVVSWILTIWIFGSLLVFLLTRVLGGEVNYSQCLGVIGYSLLPLTIVATILPAFHNVPAVSFVFKVFGVVWATYSAGSLLCGSELQRKRSLVLYPILLLYIYFLSLYTGA